jgi:hypothetical protein
MDGTRMPSGRLQYRVPCRFSVLWYIVGVWRFSLKLTRCRNGLLKFGKFEVFAEAGSNNIEK